MIQVFILICGMNFHRWNPNWMVYEIRDTGQISRERRIDIIFLFRFVFNHSGQNKDPFLNLPDVYTQSMYGFDIWTVTDRTTRERCSAFESRDDIIKCHSSTKLYMKKMLTVLGTRKRNVELLRCFKSPPISIFKTFNLFQASKRGNLPHNTYILHTWYLLLK